MAKLAPLVLVVVLAVPACAPLTDLGTHAPLRGVVYQRGSLDCGVAALAMLHRVTYAKVDALIPDQLLYTQGGLTDLNLIYYSFLLGQPAIWTKWPADQPDPPRGFDGILHIAIGDFYHHYVYLTDGVIYDPLGELPESYARFRVRIGFRFISSITLAPPDAVLTTLPMG